MPTFNGTNGADIIDGTAENDFIDGFGGDDALSGADGRDFIRGGDGDDTLNGGDGDDELYGGDGLDVIYAGAGNDKIDVVTSSEIVPGEVIDGGDGFDTLTISTQADSNSALLDISGLSLTSIESLRVSGRSAGITSAQLNGITLLEGGFTLLTPGAFSLNNISATHAAFGLHNAGSQLDLRGFYASSFVLVTGSAANDRVRGGSSAEEIRGEGGSDVIDGGGGSDRLSGGDGNDVITGGSASDTLFGGPGADIFIDTIAGLNGDYLYDFEAGDRIIFIDAILSSFEYSYTYVFGELALAYTGGTLIFAHTENLGTLTASALSGGGVELRFAGTTGTPWGSSANDQFSGTADADVYYGYGGDDHLAGLEGADILNGGDGDDMLSADRENGFDNQRDVDEIDGGAGNDLILSGYGDIVDGGDGFDTVGLSYVGALQGITGDTAILHQGVALLPGAGTFQNVERFSDIALTAYDDRMVIGDQTDPAVVRSWDGDDQLIGQMVSITMFGGNGSDMLVGSTGNDVLYGEAGNDILMGYLGADELWGGDGSDRFMITHLNTAARVGDFEHGLDKIDVSSLDASSAVGGDQAFNFIGTADFSGTAGELRGVHQGSYVILGDVNGDQIADFVIDLGVSPALSSSDFLL